MLAPVHLMMERSLGSGDLYSSRTRWLDGFKYEYLSVLGAIALAGAAWL
jgi:hypothetical protein